MISHIFRYLRNKQVPLSAMRRVPESRVFSTIKGKLDILSLTLIMFLLIAWGYLSTWREGFPKDYEYLSLIWSLALGGMAIHLFAWGVERDWTIEFSELRESMMLFGAGFSAIVLLQSAIILSQRTSFSFSILPANILYAATGVAEEFVFAFCTFTFFLFILSSLGAKGVILAMLANATLFTSFHLAVRSIAYQGQPSFLPAIFVGRFVLDGVYYMSSGRVSIPASIHASINLIVSMFRMV